MVIPSQFFVSKNLSYFPNVLLSFAAAFPLIVLVASNREEVGATGHIKTLPVPRYTLTSPSPLTADPTNDFVLLSTVKSRSEDQHTARFPSIFSSSFSKTISINSSSGTLLSNATTPCP